MNPSLYLITSNHMNNNKYISSNNKPTRFLKWQKDVIINRVSESPITKDSDRKITQSHN